VDVPYHPLSVWLGFTALVVGLLALDLGVLNRRAHVLTMREAAIWSASIVAIALAFGAYFWWREGGQVALEFYTGYLIELSLSVDNLFVFILIFQYFSVPAELQPRVLKWGILGAIVMRAIMIALGAMLLEQFTWIIYVFGGILILTGFKMFKGGNDQIEPEKNPIIRLARRVVRVTPAYEGQSFMVKDSVGWHATPLLLVLLMVEWSDLVFAIDSIPAIFAVTRDPFIVYSSNIFAILGLRALFFVLAGAMDRFIHLKTGIAAILVFVGVKMVLSAWYHLPTTISLGVIVLFLGTAIWASIRHTPEEDTLRG
jgi:tellurite resistance protein TerC